MSFPLVLDIEQIGNPKKGFRPAWVDLVTGIGPSELIKDRMAAHVDYSRANSIGSRGVYRHYLLREEHIYHVSAPQSWSRTDQYFCRVEGRSIIRMSMQEVVQWLIQHTARELSGVRWGSRFSKQRSNG